LPFPGPRASIPATTEFRSTWIVSSLESLRACGHFEQYRAHLPDHQDEILSCIAGAWLPIAAARSHYRACDALNLTPEQALAMVRSSGGQIHRFWHASLISSAERAGASPWEVLSQLHRVWRRGANGGAVAVFRRGNREARAEYVGCELFDIPYFRRAVGRMLFALGERFAEKLSVEDAPTSESDPALAKLNDSAAYRLRWG
jgi:hypothetical protein